MELESNPALWLLAVSQLRVRDTFCSYSVMELCTKGLGLQTEALKVRGHSVHFETLSQEVRGQTQTLFSEERLLQYLSIFYKNKKWSN